MNVAVKKKLVDNGADCLGRHSLRAGSVGIRNRERLAAAFVDTMESQGDRAMFRRKAGEYGVPLIVIVLLIGIAWDILFYWWTHREDRPASGC